MIASMIDNQLTTEADNLLTRCQTSVNCACQLAVNNVYMRWGGPPTPLPRDLCLGGMRGAAMWG